MKVLVVIDSLRLGGAENLLIPLAAAAPVAGVELEVLSLGPSHGPQASLAGPMRESGIRHSFLGMERLADPAGFLRLVRWIRAAAPHVVHAHLEHASVLVPPAARLAGRPAFCTFHQLAGNLTGSEAAKERLALASSATAVGTVFVSEACRRSFATTYRPRRNWSVVPNGINLTAFSPRQARLPDDLGVPLGAPVVTVVAALRPAKGHDVLLDAWPADLRRVGAARLVVIGSGETEAALRRKVDSLGIAGSVVLAGARTDVPAVLGGSDLVVLPTLTEALPTALIEAAASGLPVVASDVGGVPEVVEHGSTGLLVPPGDRTALAEAISDLLLDPARRRAMGRRARQRALAEFDTTVWVRRLVRLYENALDGQDPFQRSRTRRRSQGMPSSRS